MTQLWYKTFALCKHLTKCFFPIFFLFSNSVLNVFQFPFPPNHLSAPFFCISLVLSTEIVMTNSIVTIVTFWPLAWLVSTIFDSSYITVTKDSCATTVIKPGCRMCLSSLSLSLGDEGSGGSVPFTGSERLSSSSSLSDAAVLAGRQTGPARLWFSPVVSWPSHTPPCLPEGRTQPVSYSSYHLILTDNIVFHLLKYSPLS